MNTTARQPGDQSDALCGALRSLARGAGVSQRRAQLAVGARRLDDRSRALAGLGALLATGGSSSTYEHLVADALAAGLSAEEIVGVLLEVAHAVGLARVVPAAVELADAVGYDIDRALEEADGDHDTDRRGG